MGSVLGFGGKLLAATVVVLVVGGIGFAHHTGREVAIGEYVRIGAALEVKDPLLERCKQVQSNVAGYGDELRAIQAALGSAMQHAQEKEVELIRIDREEAYKYETAKLHRQYNLSREIEEMRNRYFYHLHTVENKLQYVAEVWNYILQGCGFPPYEEANR